CVHGIDLAGIKTGHSVVVLGAGPIGLLILQLAKISGADKIIATDMVEKRRELATQLGADLALDPTRADIEKEVEEFLGGKPEVVIEAIGNPKTQSESLNLVRPGGTVIWFGVADPKVEVKVNPFYIYRNEITLKGCFVNPYTTERAIRLLAEGRIKVKELITHRFRLNQLDEAMRVYREDKERVKILMKPH
ncbi:alcohol dehydrogenase, partial [Candidatus Aerophobetes bacterium]